MNKHLSACIAALALSGTALCANAQEIVRIGHVGPLTGGIAHLGKDNENGARLAIEELNARGVTIGGKPVKLELVTEDDAADPRQGTLAAQKLVDMKVAGVIGHLNSGTSIPASRIYNQAGIAQISPTATNPQLTRAGLKTVFRMVADDVQLGRSLGNYAVKNLGAKTFALIDDRTAYGQGVAAEFEKEILAGGGKVLRKEYTTDKASDFSAILTSVRGAKPDVVFFGGMDSVAGPMLRQMRQLGLSSTFIGGDGICNDGLIKLSASATNDIKVICAEAGGVIPSERARLDQFHANFKKRFGEDVKLGSPYVYDAVNVLVGAMVKAGSSKPEAYLPVLAATRDVQGVTGPVSFDGKGDRANATMTFMTFSDGKRQSLAVVKAQ